MVDYLFRTLPGCLIMIYFLFITAPVHSQNTKVRDRDYLYYSYHNSPYQLDYREIEGSPYRIDSLVEGVVRMKDGILVNASLRFNIYEDAIEYLDGQSILVVENIDEIDHIVIGKEKIIYKEYALNRQGYVVEKVSGMCTLYARYIIEYKEVKAPLTSYHRPQPESFVSREPQWYVSFNDGPLDHVKLNGSDLERVFGEYFTEIENYKKQEKLKYGREEDVTKIFEYYNQLLMSTGI